MAEARVAVLVRHRDVRHNPARGGWGHGGSTPGRRELGTPSLYVDSALRRNNSKGDRASWTCMSGRSIRRAKGQGCGETGRARLREGGGEGDRAFGGCGGHPRRTVAVPGRHERQLCGSGAPGCWR
eukprot:7386084-Prymnesium_polylepis.1